MRIAQIANPYLPVPPFGYGSVERVVDGLCRGLKGLGHDVVLFASSDSTCEVERFPGLTPSRYDRPLDVYVESAYVYEVYEHLDGFDIVHDHTMIGPVHAATRRDLHLVTTCHERFEELTTPIYRAQSEYTSLIALSEAHARTAPFRTTVIPTGVDMDMYQPTDEVDDYLLFLGRMLPEKGPHIAIDIARAAGMPLKIAARVTAKEEREFFESMVKPKLGGDVEFVGEVGGQERLDILRRALGLLMPLQWDEPFGLVMIEALASGAPVIAFPRGSAPEIVRHGMNGYLCADEGEAVDACGRLDGIDRSACRSDAVERFSIERMARDHVALYEQLLTDQDRMVAV